MTALVLPLTRKPDRKVLVSVIQELQGLIGQAIGKARDDRDPNRMENLQQSLEFAFDLCVEAVSFDPPHVPKQGA